MDDPDNTPLGIMLRADLTWVAVPTDAVRLTEPDSAAHQVIISLADAPSRIAPADGAPVSNGLDELSFVGAPEDVEKAVAEGGTLLLGGKPSDVGLIAVGLTFIDDQGRLASIAICGINRARALATYLENQGTTGAALIPMVTDPQSPERAAAIAERAAQRATTGAPAAGPP